MRFRSRGSPTGSQRRGARATSVLRNVVPLQDGLNHSLASLIVGSEAFSQPLRLLLGMEESEDKVVSLVAGELQIQDRQKVSIDPTKDSIVKVPGANTRAHQFDPPDATKLIAVQDAFAAKMSRAVGLPAFDINSSLGNVPSGSSLRVLRERKTTAIQDFLQDVTPEWSRVMRLLGVPDAEPEWGEVSALDPLEKAQLIQAKHSIGYPFEELLRDFGEGPEDVKRILAAKQSAEASVAAEGAAPAAGWWIGQRVAVTLTAGALRDLDRGKAELGRLVKANDTATTRAWAQLWTDVEKDLLKVLNELAAAGVTRTRVLKSQRLINILRIVDRSLQTEVGNSANRAVTALTPAIEASVAAQTAAIGRQVRDTAFTRIDSGQVRAIVGRSTQRIIKQTGGSHR